LAAGCASAGGLPLDAGGVDRLAPLVDGLAVVDPLLQRFADQVVALHRDLVLPGQHIEHQRDAVKGQAQKNQCF